MKDSVRDKENAVAQATKKAAGLRFSRYAAKLEAERKVNHQKEKRS